MKLLIIGILTVSLTALSTTQQGSVYGQNTEKQNDLVFNVQELKTSPNTKDFQIKGQVWDEICPSGQCQIEEEGYSLYVVTPDRSPSAPRVYLGLDFLLHDDITNKDLTPLQKIFVEQYELYFGCNVNSVKDIIEQGNNTTYKCSGGSTFLKKANQEKTDSTYFFNTEGIYNNQSDTFNATAQFTYKM